MVTLKIFNQLLAEDRLDELSKRLESMAGMTGGSGVDSSVINDLMKRLEKVED
jgi:tetrahydromethanopterin S-methyltransferase subunit G